jgi:hypothetical protein
MELLLLMLFLVLFVPVGFMMALATWGALGISSLRRANKVVPSRSAISAPLRWLWSPSPAALLHRRLRSACALAGSVEGALPTQRWPRRRTEPVNDGIVSLAREVLQEAVALDQQLQSTSLLPRGVSRDQALSALDYQVRGLEDASRRVLELATRRAQLARPAGPGTLNLNERITAMEAALGELAPRPPAG